MKKVLITGSKGVVGEILTKGLEKTYTLSLADLPEFDIRSYNTVLGLTQDQDAIIHLAWNTETEHGGSLKEDSGNTDMWMNVYNAALANHVPRVVMASSIQATNYMSLKQQGIVSPKMDAPSKSVYGKHKRSLERKGELYSQKGLEVICVRLGGVCGENEKPLEYLKRDGLAHPDLITLFQACLDAKTVPDNYVILYGVSKSGRSIFDLSNPFDWQPKFDAAEFYNLQE